MFRKFAAAAVRQVTERGCRVRMATGMLGRDNLVVEPDGIELTHYRQNPIILFDHSPERPVGRAVGFDQTADSLDAEIEFAPAGVSAIADEICGLVKAGIIGAVSIGFAALDQEPVDPRDRRAGTRVTRCELMETSFVSVPADRGAVVLERGYGARAAAAAAVRRWVSRHGSAPVFRFGAADHGGSAIDRRPIYRGDPVRFAAEMRDWLAQALAGHAATATGSAPLSFAERQRELAQLSRRG